MRSTQDKIRQSVHHGHRRSGGHRPGGCGRRLRGQHDRVRRHRRQLGQEQGHQERDHQAQGHQGQGGGQAEGSDRSRLAPQVPPAHRAPPPTPVRTGRSWTATSSRTATPICGPGRPRRHRASAASGCARARAVTRRRRQGGVRQPGRLRRPSALRHQHREVLGLHHQREQHGRLFLGQRPQRRLRDRPDGPDGRDSTQLHHAGLRADRLRWRPTSGPTWTAAPRPSGT